MRAPISRRALAASLLLCVTPAVGGAQPIISTLPAWDGTSVLSGIGLPGSAAVGQTIAAPTAGASLVGFSFNLSGDFLSANPGGLLYRGYVMAWDGTRATGPALYASDVRRGASTTAVERVDFDFGAVPLTGGASYVLFLSRLGLAGQMDPEPDHQNRFGFVATDAYADGRLVFFNQLDEFGDDPSRLTQDAWGQRANIDMAFEARFATTTTPEPATFLLAGAGLLVIAGARVVRRRVHA